MYCKLLNDVEPRELGSDKIDYIRRTAFASGPLGVHCKVATRRCRPGLPVENARVQVAGVLSRMVAVYDGLYKRGVSGLSESLGAGHRLQEKQL